MLLACVHRLSKCVCGCMCINHQLRPLFVAAVSIIIPFLLLFFNRVFLLLFLLTAMCYSYVPIRHTRIMILSIRSTDIFSRLLNLYAFVALAYGLSQSETESRESHLSSSIESKQAFVETCGNLTNRR